MFKGGFSVYTSVIIFIQLHEHHTSIKINDKLNYLKLRWTLKKAIIYWLGIFIHAFNISPLGVHHRFIKTLWRNPNVLVFETISCKICETVSHSSFKHYVFENWTTWVQKSRFNYILDGDLIRANLKLKDPTSP